MPYEPQLGLKFGQRLGLFGHSLHLSAPDPTDVEPIRLGPATEAGFVGEGFWSIGEKIPTGWEEIDIRWPGGGGQQSGGGITPAGGIGNVGTTLDDFTWRPTDGQHQRGPANESPTRPGTGGPPSTGGGPNYSNDGTPVFDMRVPPKPTLDYDPLTPEEKRTLEKYGFLEPMPWKRSVFQFQNEERVISPPTPRQMRAIMDAAKKVFENPCFGTCQ